MNAATGSNSGGCSFAACGPRQMGYRARGRMPKSPILAFYLDSFKAAAGEGAVLGLKLRLLAGKVPTLRKYAHQQNLGNIEDELATHFGDALSVAEKDMLRLCRQLRNKVLHSGFYAARGKLGGTRHRYAIGRREDDPVAGSDGGGICEEDRRGESRERKAQRMSPTRCPRMRGSVYGWFSKRAPPAVSDKACDAFKRGRGDH